MGMLIGMRLNATGTPTGNAGADAPAQAGAAGMPSPGLPTWSAVYRDVLQAPGCSSGPACHSSALAGQLKLSTQAEAYAALVSVKAMGASSSGVSCSATDRLRVAPGDADASLLVQKLTAAAPVCGQHMPPGGMLRPEQIEQLRMWIADGAKNN